MDSVICFIIPEGEFGTLSSSSKGDGGGRTESSSEVTFAYKVEADDSWDVRCECVCESRAKSSNLNSCLTVVLDGVNLSKDCIGDESEGLSSVLELRESSVEWLRKMSVSFSF